MYSPLSSSSSSSLSSTSSKSSSCIFGHIPYYFKLCLFLCLMCLFIVYYSTIKWKSGFQETQVGDRKWSSQLPVSNSTEKYEQRRISPVIPVNDWSRMCAGNATQTEIDRLFPPQDEAEIKYVLPGYSYLCGGLGNQFWRFASLYGIGKPYGRRPIFTEDQRCQEDHGPHEVDGEKEEIRTIFPVYGSQLKHIKLDINNTFILDNYAKADCRYDDPQRVKFSRFKEKYVQIKSNYFQSYKFFESRRNEIRQIFQFSQTICAAVQKYQAELFRGQDKAHKLCVHTRLEDFKNFGYETNRNFTEKGIEFAYRHLKKKFHDDKPISLILMGADKHFLTNLNINRTFIPNVYLPKPSPRGFDLAFATTACDSLLITAPASTFSWWIGYLMPDDTTIFYNADIEHTPYERQNFLPEWIPIRMVNGSKIILD